MSARSTRRNFLHATAALAGTAAAISIVPRHVLGGPRKIPPSEKMNVAGIGIGGMGAGNLADLAGREYRRPVRRGSEELRRQDDREVPAGESLQPITARCSTSRRTSTACWWPRPTTPTR